MIKAIETRYKGYRFRSRLEARWAVFLDYLGVTWEYEYEGYDLGKGVWYLPDFRITHINPDEHQEPYTWLEIKATTPSEDEIHKLQRVMKPGEYGLFLCGTPGEHQYLKVWPTESRQVGNLRELFIDVCFWTDCWLEEESWLQNAITAARSARFEFGEQGVPK